MASTLRKAQHHRATLQLPCNQKTSPLHSAVAANAATTGLPMQPATQKPFLFHCFSRVVSPLLSIHYSALYGLPPEQILRPPLFQNIALPQRIFAVAGAPGPG